MRRSTRRWGLLGTLVASCALFEMNCSLNLRDALLAGAYDFVTSTTTTALQSIVDAAMGGGGTDTAGNESEAARSSP